MSYVKQGFTNGQVLKAEHLNHIEDGLSKAVVGYEEGGIVEVLAETILDMTSGDTTLPTNIGLVAGKEYTVVWNGTSYTCTAFIVEEEGVQLVCLGDVDGDGTHTHPFTIGEVPADMVGAVGCAVMIGGWESGMVSIAITTESTVIHPIDKKFLPEHLQFGEETSQVEVLAETTLTEPITDEGYSIFELPVVIPAKVGEPYNVIWNGTEYSCKGATPTDFPGVMIGNLSIADVGEDSGEPFVIQCYPPEAGFAVILSNDGSTSATISIYQQSTVITPIEGKYLPKPLQIGDEDVVIIPKTTLNFEPQDNFGGMVGAVLTVEAAPDLWNYTIINYNGVDYKCTATGFGSGDRCFLGNTALASALIPDAVDTGEPFFVYYIASSMWAILPKDSSVPATFSVRVPKAVPLNYRYIDFPVLDLYKIGLNLPSGSGTVEVEVDEDFIRYFRRIEPLGVVKLRQNSGDDDDVVATHYGARRFVAYNITDSGARYITVRLNQNAKILSGTVHTISWT